jgi:NADH-quinone oxidoreductase subunit J
MSAEAFLFYLMGAFAVAGALAMVLNVRNTVASALSLVITMIALGGIYVLLHAHLIAVVQIMVYAGAIVVLFVFVVMLLNLREDAFPPGRLRLYKLLGVGLGLWVLGRFLASLGPHLPEAVELPETFGGYRHLGRALFTDYVLAFEMTSLILLAAIVGAVILAKRRIGP